MNAKKIANTSYQRGIEEIPVERTAWAKDLDLYNDSSNKLSTSIPMSHPFLLFLFL